MNLCNLSPIRPFLTVIFKLVVASLIWGLPGCLLAADQDRFSSTSAAVDALKAAVQVRNTNALRGMFGVAAHDLVSFDAVKLLKSASCSPAASRRRSTWFRSPTPRRCCTWARTAGPSLFPWSNTMDNGFSIPWPAAKKF